MLQLEYRLVQKWGKTYMEFRYTGLPWSNWLFATSKTPHRYWKYYPEFDLYVSNVSID